MSILTNETLKETKFLRHKLMTSDLILKLQETKFTKQADTTSTCGSSLLFSHQRNIITQDTRNRLKKANFCKFRFCPMCSWRRRLNLGQELLEALEGLNSTRKLNFLFLTLTIKNCKINDLRATIKHLNKSFNEMTRTKQFKNSIQGYLKCTELLGDNTPDGEAHPHLHILLLVDSRYFADESKYISQNKFREMWQNALRVDYLPLVNVQKIKPKPNSNLTAIQSAVFEVAKYSLKHTKLTELSNDDFTTMILQSARVRFFSTGGILKERLNLQKIDEELIAVKKQLEEEWQEIEELLYKFQNGDYYKIESPCD